MSTHNMSKPKKPRHSGSVPYRTLLVVTLVIAATFAVATLGPATAGAVERAFVGVKETLFELWDMVTDPRALAGISYPHR